MSKLKQAIAEAINKQYVEFATDNFGTSRAEEEYQILCMRFLGGQGKNTQVCAVYMAMVLVKNILDSFSNIANSFGKVESHLISWLVEEQKHDYSVEAQLLFPNIGVITGSQVYDEICYVLYYALQCTKKDFDFDDLIELLEPCLIGDAITSDPQKRRLIFEWWLKEVFISTVENKYKHLS